MLYFGRVGSSWGYRAFFGSSWGEKVITPSFFKEKKKENLKNAERDKCGGKIGHFPPNFPPFHGALSLSHFLSLSRTNGQPNHSLFGISRSSLSLLSACSFSSNFGGCLCPATSDFPRPSSSTQVTKSLSLYRAFYWLFPPNFPLSRCSLSLSGTNGKPNPSLLSACSCLQQLW
jgi:hypothetical protein